MEDKSKPQCIGGYSIKCFTAAGEKAKWIVTVYDHGVSIIHKRIFTTKDPEPLYKNGFKRLRGFKEGTYVQQVISIKMESLHDIYFASAQLLLNHKRK